MRKKLKMWVFTIAAVCVLCLSGAGKELQVVYADTEDVEVEEEVTFEEGYVSEDGKWNCTLVKHEYESDGEVRQIVEISIVSYREKVEYGATKMTIPEKMRVRRNEEEDWSEEYYVTRIESMDDSLLKSNVKSATSVTLPKTVISIGDEAFSWMTALEEVKISQDTDAGIEQAVLESYWLNNSGIGYRAFYQCEKLTSVEVPTVLREIGMYAFVNCERLQSINLPNGVTRIDEGAFSGCAFTEISLPESITEIGSCAFKDCDKLTAIEFPPELTELAGGVVSGCKALTEITVPSKVTAIGDGAFYCCLNLAEITFAEDAPIDVIGSRAFECCENLTGISLPDTVTEIGTRAFDRCTSLMSVKLPEQLTEVPSYCFSDCKRLISVVVPNSVEKIGSSAFSGCTSLETVVIPKNAEITYLDFAFTGCDAEKLTIYTEEGSFVMENLDININFGFRCMPVHGAVSAVLETEDGWKYMEDGEEGIKIVDYDGGLENLIIPEFSDAAVTSVSGRIWKNNTTIKSIQIPDTVAYIGADAFNGCTGLTEINLPSSLEYIGDNALKDCGTIDNKNIPENIKYIGDYAFCGWTELEKAVIPANVERLGEHAFDGCVKLESVEFKGASETDLEGEFEIGNSAFLNCDLKNLELPGNCIGIHEKAFAGNTGLKTVVLPDSMKIISNRVFENCTALESINLPSNLVCVADYVFAGCEKLSGITIPQGAEHIYDGAFSGCKALSKIEIPDSVNGIDSYAFKDCTGLSEITIPETVTSIGRGAFEGCTGLSEITIPEKVASIGREALKGCTGLTKATIPSKATKIKENAFSGCPALTIYTVSDSDALRYAKENSIPYVLLDGGSNTSGGNDNTGGGDGNTSDGNDSGGDNDNLVTTEGDGNTNSVPAVKGETLTVTGQKCTVKVTSANKANPQVAYIGTTNKKATQVKVPDKVSVNGITYKVTSIADKAFYKNKKIKTVTVGKNVTSIGKNAFRNCTNLKTVTIKSTGLKKIGANAFNGDKKLTKITLKTTKLTKNSIGKNALKGTNKKLIIKAPGKKVSTYKSYFKNKGNKNVKIKK